MSEFQFSKIHQEIFSMLEPEEDFPTWLMILQSSIDQIEDFGKFIPSIEKLAKSIEETDELPEPIQKYTNDFIQRLFNEIARPALKFGTLSETQLEIIFSFFKIIIKLSCYGINRGDTFLISLFPSLVNNQEVPLFKNNIQYEFHKKNCDYANECGYLANGIKSLSESPSTMEVIYYIYFGCHFIINYTNPNDFWNLASLVEKSILNICEESLRNVNTSLVTTLFTDSLNSALRFEKIEDDLILQWLTIFSSFVCSDIFEKQLYGLKAINSLINRNETKNIVIDWFRSPDNVKIVSGHDMHSEFIALYNSILPELAAADILTDIFLTNLWNLHTVQHSTQLYQFFMIFNFIATKLNVELMNDYVNMCLHPNIESEAWVRFIHQLGLTLGRRGDSETSFLLIRDKLLSLLTNQILCNIVLNLLPELLPFYLNSGNVVQLTHSFKDKFDNSIVFYQLMQQTSKIAFDDNELAVEMLENAIICVTYNPENSQLIFDFITNICTANNISIPEDQLEALFKLSETPNFYTFLISLIKGEFVSSEWVEHFIVNKDPQTVNQSFFELVKEFINKVNKETALITKLPIEKEDLLWLWSTTKSDCVDLFTDYLCKLYSCNDGVELTDLVMIRTFLSKWFDVSQTRDLDLLLRLMKCFIDTIEQSLDVSFYDVKRHNSSFDLNTITVEVTGIQLPAHQTHVVPENMLLSALKHRIARTAMIPMNKLKIMVSQIYVHENEPVKSIANNEKTVNISIKVLDKEKCPLYHERSCIPSQVISQSSFIVQNLINYLKENNENAKKILDCLPTDISTLMQIDEIPKKEHFDYSELLPVQYPLLFRYNLEAVKIRLTQDKLRSSMILIESFDKTGGFTYLADHIDSPDLMASIVPFLEEELSNDLKIQLGQKLFDSLFPSLVLPDHDSNMFVQNALFLTNIASLSRIELPEQFYSEICNIVFSDNNFVQKYGNQLLAKLFIPLQAFLDQLTEENQDVIFNVCLPHVDSFLPLFYEKFLEDPQNNSILSIIEKSLELNLIEDDGIKSKIQEVLIQNYLTVDSRPKNKDCFSIALRCLTYLQTEVLSDHLTQLHDMKSSCKSYQIDGDSTTVSPTGFSGLINLGATCFLNSTLQQFFAIPPLRKSIIEYKGKDQFMIQLRNLFAKMLLSEGHTISTEELVNEWTGWNNEKMDPRFQQDACEFSQILIDKLEKGLGKPFIHALFEGTTVDNIEGISDTYHAMRSQTVYTFTIPIKDLNNINDALLAMQAPDFFTGTNQYYADSLDRKIDAKKFQMIGSLPPYLIIQLSRFSYDYNTWERTKIDTLFEFPVDLDLSQYVSKKDQITQFKLRGVILHSGTAQYGHYVSCVADRASGKWRCCNDSKVTEISEEEMLNSAFGRSSCKNAYLLFYDRIDTLENLTAPSIHCVHYDSSEEEEDNQQEEIEEAIDQQNENNEHDENQEPTGIDEHPNQNGQNDSHKEDASESNKKNVENKENENADSDFEIDFEESNDIYISESLYEQIQREKRLNNEYSLFCSSPYFEFCTILSKSNIMHFAFIALRYFFDTLPFTNHVDRCIQIGQNLINQLEEHADLTDMFSQFLANNVFHFALVFSPSNVLRNYSLEMIDSLGPDQYKEEFLQQLFNLIDQVIPYFQFLNEYFELFNRITAKSEQVSLFAVNHLWVDRFSKFLIEDIPGYLQANQQLKPTYFYCAIDLSGLFKTIANLNPPEELIKYVLNFETFKFFLFDPRRPCDASSLIELLGNFNDAHAVKDFITQFAAHYGIYVDSFKLLHVIYRIMQFDSFAVMSSSILRIKEDLDFASSLAGEAMYDLNNDPNRTFHQILLDNLDQWIIKYLINDNPSCRLITLYIIAFIIPVTLFNDLQVIQPINTRDVYGPIQLNLSIDLNSTEDQTTIDFVTMNAQKILEYFFDNIQEIADKINDSEVPMTGVDFLYCIDKLACITKTNITEFLINFATNLLKPTQAFDTQMKEILRILVREMPEEITFDLILHFTNYPVFSDPVLRQSHTPLFDDKGSFLRALNFFACIECVADSLTPPIEFVDIFVTDICYTPYQPSAVIYNAISKFVKRFSFLYPDLFIAYLQTNLEKVAINCYSMLIVTLETISTKMPILKYLAKAATKKQFFTLDELIIKSFELNEEDETENQDNVEYEYEYEYEYNDSEYNEYAEEEEKDDESNKQPVRKRIRIKNNPEEGICSIVSLLNSPQIPSGSPARSLIWDLIYKEKPSYELFKSIYSWRGDIIQYTRYLLIIAPILIANENNSLYKECLEDIIECAKKSSDSFALSADYLCENDLDEILQKGFSEYILKLDIGENIDVYVKYLNLLFDSIKETIGGDAKDLLKQCQEYLMPLIDCVGRRVKFLIDVFEDLKTGGITDSDLRPLFAPLKLLTVYKDIIQDSPLINDLIQLLESCKNHEIIQKVTAKTDLQTLGDLISNIL